MSRRRAWSSLLLLLAAVVALWAMQRSTPNYTRLMAPMETRGHPGALVRGRSLAARVDRVDLARSLRLGRFDGPRTFDSGGVWLIVHATATSVERPLMIMSAAVETEGGVTYRRTERLGGSPMPLSSRLLQPEVLTSGQLIFELPASALAGADLLLSDHLVGPLDSVLRIHLPLDAATVTRQLAALPDHYELERPR